MTGFIDRDGKFYECKYFEHDETALRIFGKRLEFLDVKFMKVSIGLRTDILLVCLPRPMNR